MKKILFKQLFILSTISLCFVFYNNTELSSMQTEETDQLLDQLEKEKIDTIESYDAVTPLINKIEELKARITELEEQLEDTEVLKEESSEWTLCKLADARIDATKQLTAIKLLLKGKVSQRLEYLKRHSLFRYSSDQGDHELAVEPIENFYNKIKNIKYIYKILYACQEFVQNKLYSEKIDLKCNSVKTEIISDPVAIVKRQEHLSPRLRRVMTARTALSVIIIDGIEIDPVFQDFCELKDAKIITLTVNDELKKVIKNKAGSLVSELLKQLLDKTEPPTIGNFVRTYKENIDLLYDHIRSHIWSGWASAVNIIKAPVLITNAGVTLLGTHPLVSAIAPQFSSSSPAVATYRYDGLKALETIVTRIQAKFGTSPKIEYTIALLENILFIMKNIARV